MDTVATILVIDDEEFIRSLVMRILKKNDYNVITAENGESGVSIFQENAEKIDLAIIDMTMEEMNGLEVLEKIRLTSPGLPGIISSGNSYDENDVPEGLSKNLYFLQKPYRSQQLTDLVNSILIPV